MDLNVVISVAVWRSKIEATDFFSLSRLLFGLFGEMPIPLLSHTKVNWKLCLHQNKQNAIDFIPSRRERAIRNSNNLIDFLICIFKDEVEQRKKAV